jgi:NADH-quinone oxidoreductase subunit J
MEQLTAEIIFFWLVAGLTALCAIAVVVTQNIVRSAAWLLFTLAGTAGIYFLLGADFVAATQLIVYVGGVLVLVVFGVMLTAQGPFIVMKTSPAEWAISTLVGLLFLGILVITIVAEKFPQKLPEQGPAAVIGGTPADSRATIALGQAFLGVKEAAPEANLTGLPAGQSYPRTRVSYLLPFEIISVHLLVVLIGAAYLARAKRRKEAAS